MVGSLFWALVRDPALGQRCAFVRAFTGVVSAAPDRQAGAALGSHHRYWSSRSPSAPDRLARRSVNPGFRLGWHRESACSGAGLSLAKRRGQPPQVHDRRAQDGALDKPKGRHRFGHARRRRATTRTAWAASQTAWATAAARRGTRAAAPTAARTARTELILRPATPCRCAAGASPTTPASTGSYPHRNPSASRRRSRAPSASSTSS